MPVSSSDNQSLGLWLTWRVSDTQGLRDTKKKKEKKIEEMCLTYLTYESILWSNVLPQVGYIPKWTPKL